MAVANLSSELLFVILKHKKATQTSYKSSCMFVQKKTRCVLNRFKDYDLGLLTKSKSRPNNKRGDHCNKSGYILIHLVW